MKSGSRDYISGTIDSDFIGGSVFVAKSPNLIFVKCTTPMVNIIIKGMLIQGFLSTVAIVAAMYLIKLASAGNNT